MTFVTLARMMFSARKPWLAANPGSPGRLLPREPWLPKDQDDREDQHDRTERDQGVAHSVQLERAGDAHQEQDGGQEHRDPDVVVADEPVGAAGGELLVGLLDERRGP